jgi:hypothetical protein
MNRLLLGFYVDRFQVHTVSTSTFITLLRSISFPFAGHPHLKVSSNIWFKFRFGARPILARDGTEVMKPEEWQKNKPRCSDVVSFFFFNFVFSCGGRLLRFFSFCEPSGPFNLLLRHRVLL